MTYPEVCASNQALYEELESLSDQILHPKLADKLNMAAIHSRRNEIKMLIDNNLEWMEFLWREPVEYRRAYRKNMTIPPIRELYIISTYRHNPSIPMDKLAAIAKVSTDIANRTITAYLTKKYCLPDSFK
jgi:hypothetical protein